MQIIRLPWVVVAHVWPAASSPHENSAMSRIQRVLAATDLSAPARHAAERAARVARELGAALALLHVISATPLERLRRLVATGRDDVHARIETSIREEIDRLAERLRSLDERDTQVLVATGNLGDEIRRLEAARQVDLLVVGSRGAGFLRHRILGTTAERLVRGTATPVLVVKQPAHESYRRMLVAVDFTPTSRHALHVARTIAPAAELVVLHAYTVPFEEWMRPGDVGARTLDHYRKAARRDASADLLALQQATAVPPGTAAALLLEGDPSIRICEQEQVRDCDLIVVGKQGESPLEQFLIGSVTQHVLQESQADVLVVPGPVDPAA